jgi:hypothetical protein
METVNPLDVISDGLDSATRQNERVVQTCMEAEEVKEARRRPCRVGDPSWRNDTRHCAARHPSLFHPIGGSRGLDFGFPILWNFIILYYCFVKYNRNNPFEPNTPGKIISAQERRLFSPPRCTYVLLWSRVQALSAHPDHSSIKLHRRSKVTLPWFKAQTLPVSGYIVVQATLITSD